MLIFVFFHRCLFWFSGIVCIFLTTCTVVTRVAELKMFDSDLSEISDTTEFSKICNSNTDWLSNCCVQCNIQCNMVQCNIYF